MSIEISNLSKSFKKKEVLKKLNFSLEPGNMYFLTSVNGTGKTTFLKCLFREYEFEGLIHDEMHQYTYLPEKVNFPPFLTASEFLRLFNPAIDIEHWLANFNISEYENVPLEKLSKGTLQKIAIIKTLNDPADVFLFDEPLNGLDNDSRMTFMNCLEELSKKKTIIVISTHYYYDYPFPYKKVLEIC